MKLNREDIDSQLSAALIQESAEDLYERAPCGYLSTLPNGLIVKINSTLLGWLGWERQEVLYEKKLQDFFAIGGRIFYETHHAPLLKMQGFVNELTYDLQLRQGGVLPVLLNSIQLKDTEGAPLLNRITVFNITDRRKYERELLQAKKKAEEAAKVKAAFLSTVSHEFRTPMNAIIGIADLLHKTPLSQKQAHFVEVLKFSSENLLNLINDILDFSKIESGRMVLEERHFNLPLLLHSILSGFQYKADEKGLQLGISLDPQLPRFVYGDSVKLGQVLTNLLGNAIKFTERGWVRLQVQVLEQTAAMARLQVQVSDSGIGIPKEQHERIFEEFTQASPEINVKYGGTGLGLPICQRLLQLFGSKLSLRSQPGEGAAFFFTLELPIGLAEAATRLQAEQGADPAQASTPSLQQVRLLLAEDNEINVLVVSEYLDEWGVQYDVVADGQQAVALATQKEYDLVLMDLQMPVMDGYQAAAAIRALPGGRYARLPIIAFTASAKFDYKQRIVEAGITELLGKPFRPEELHRLIAHYAVLKPIAQQPPATEPQPSAAAPQDEPADGGAISLRQYKQITRDNQESLIKLILLTITHFEDYKKGFAEAILTRDTDKIAALAHKIKMTLQMLEADQLAEHIRSSRALLATAAERELHRANRRIQEALDCAIVELKMHLHKK
ncbi:PAS domain-containing hybrid sensor histidine kinase/response regulator [Cesiribacter andamanensis]|uniref:histidine kinase n=1 Tax=Cesiribacter andamanensis AMV16 TaxID=1279009 RepID=M7NNI5_9BACT|nr:PAS domain-containing hybrid sensor histidine kinase/response regulator [Cesiribacter andamanensis]EMR03260.1 Autoinducer 2 sensor kinase/phosphatase luxQ [Cesiribacter andamanensis AMV16]